MYVCMYVCMYVVYPERGGTSAAAEGCHLEVLGAREDVTGEVLGQPLPRGESHSLAMHTHIHTYIHTCMLMFVGS